MIDEKNFPDIVTELRQLLQSVKGVKSISEDLSITYIVQVETEQDKEPVEKVGMALSSQAERFGFAIEVVPATTDEINEARTRYAEHLAKETKFKA